MFWKIFMIVLFFGITTGIGLYYNKKSQNKNDFVLGGRNVGPWLSAFSYGTTYFSATIFVGYAGQFGWSYGVSAFWIGIGNALIGSLVAWTLLGRRTRIMTKHLGAATMPEFFAKRYDSTGLKLLSSIIIFIFLVPYTSSVYKGLSGLFAISFGVDFIWCIIGMAVLTCIFVVAGGYMGTAVNNFIQGIIMLAGIVAVVWKVLSGFGGFTEAFEALSLIKCESNPNLAGAYTSMFGPDPIGLLSVILLTSVGTLGLPQMVHKFYAIKDEKSIKLGTIISTVFALVIAGGSYFLGGFGRLSYSSDKVVFDDIIPTMIEKSLPDVLVGVVLLMVLAASISTLASLVLTSSSTFVSDFVKTFSGVKLKDKSELLFIRIMCVFFIVLSVVIALIPNSLITSLMGLSWGALAGAFLGPFIYGLFWKRTTIASVWASMISGVAIVVLNFILKITTSSIAGATAMAFSIIIVPIVSLITPKGDSGRIDACFSCYNQTVTAVQSEVLIDEEKVKS